MTAHKLTFILGGARSGKSAYGERLIGQLPPPWTYVATAQVFDDEMDARIKAHQVRRDERWQTIEAPHNLVDRLNKLPDGSPVLIDCLTLWLTNMMLGEFDLDSARDELINMLKKPRGPWFVVSNETGLGIVPENNLARRFRDEAGILNQRVAAVADDVVFMVAGLPMQVK